MKTNKKYYILYKTITNEENEIIDIQYIKEYEKQEDIKNDIKATYRDIKKMVNNNIDNFKTLKLHKNYCIIKE